MVYNCCELVVDAVDLFCKLHLDHIKVCGDYGIIVMMAVSFVNHSCTTRTLAIG